MAQLSIPELTQTLVSRKDDAWQALSRGTGADFYQDNLTSDALMVFPFGVLDREASIASLREAPPWATYQISDPQVVPFTVTSAILTYLATAQRADAQPYAARMTTVFVRNEEGWKTGFHQQTPTG